MLRRRSGNGIWKGLYEYLLVENPEEETPESWGNEILDCLLEGNKRAGRQGEGGLEHRRGGVRHILTHRTIVADYYVLHLPPGAELPLKQMEAAGYFMVEETELKRYAFPSLFRKFDSPAKPSDS